MIHHLRFIELEFMITPKKEMVLPALPASAFRSGIGMALKKIVCHQPVDSSCHSCSAFQSCSYPVLFEKMNDLQIDGAYAAYVRPFVIETEITKKEKWLQNESFQFKIRLFGRHTALAHYLIFSVIELGKKGLGKTRDQFTVNIVTSQDMEGGKLTVYTDESGFTALAPIRYAEEWFQSEENISIVQLYFKTPCRVQIKGKLKKEISFSFFIQNILRRLQAISYHHHGILLDEEKIKELCEQAKEIQTTCQSLQWYSMQRYSGRQKKEVPLDGFIGNVTYEGDLTPFLPFIRAGAMLHIGKQTAFGLGWYKVKVIEQDAYSYT